MNHAPVVEKALLILLFFLMLYWMYIINEVEKELYETESPWRDKLYILMNTCTFKWRSLRRWYLEKVFGRDFYSYSNPSVSLTPGKLDDLKSKRREHILNTFLIKDEEHWLSKARGLEGVRWILNDVNDMGYPQLLRVEKISIGGRKYPMVDITFLLKWRLVAPMDEIDLYNEEFYSDLETLAEIAIRDYFKKHRQEIDRWSEILVKEDFSPIEEYVKSFNGTVAYRSALEEVAEEDPKVGEILEKFDEFTCDFYKKENSREYILSIHRDSELTKKGLEGGAIFSTGFALMNLVVVNQGVSLK
ncbi:MAG: hypothetical protein ACQEP6_03220 [Patescibacteria group bacterium]